MKRKKVFSLILSLVLIAAAIFLVLRAGRSGERDGAGIGADSGVGTGSDRADESEPAPVTVAVSERADLVADVELNGEIEAANRVSVYPEVAGTVRRIAVVEGEEVAYDQELLYVDPSVPGTQYRESPARSPIDGVVISVDTERGAEVQPQMPVATVATLDELRVSVEVPERYVPALEPRMEGKITSFAAKGSDFDAVVEKIEPTIDSSTRSKLVKLGIEESSGELSAGMFVRVELPLERALDAVSVPFEAVVQEGGEEYVYTVENGVARRVSVRTGIIAGDRVEITGGLEKGVRVIVEGHQELRPGKPVREVESEGTAE